MLPVIDLQKTGFLLCNIVTLNYKADAYAN